MKGLSESGILRAMEDVSKPLVLRGFCWFPVYSRCLQSSPPFGAGLYSKARDPNPTEPSHLQISFELFFIFSFFEVVLILREPLPLTSPPALGGKS